LPGAANGGGGGTSQQTQPGGAGGTSTGGGAGGTSTAGGAGGTATGGGAGGTSTGGVDAGGASTGGGAGGPSTSKPIWVAAWADAPDSAGGDGGTNQTFREIIKPTVGSRGKVRLHFSNFFGKTPVVLGAVHVGVQTSGAAVHDDVSVTFAGANSMTIPAGAFVTSDEVSLSFSYGALLGVTEYVKGSWTSLTQHTQAGTVTSYATAANAGDKSADLTATPFNKVIHQTYLLDRVDVFGDYSQTIAAFGSSTTDGVASGTDAHKTYPEQLAERLHAAGRDDVAVANVGIAGTTVLGDSATAGIHRFVRDVLPLPGVTAVIDNLGANDLRNSCVTADTLIAGKKNLIAQAHAAGLKIYVATTAPSTFCGAQNPGKFGQRFVEGSGEEAQRFLVLAWARKATDASLGAAAADALIDFDGAIVDPANKSYMLPSLDSGDDVHPNATGYGLMAKAIPLSLF